jgi:hypothetical protein
VNSYCKIAVLENEVESELLQAILKEQKIPHFIKSYHDIVFDGVFQIQKGWGYISSPEQYKQKILQILEDIRKSRGGINPNSD